MGRHAWRTHPAEQDLFLSRDEQTEIEALLEGFNSFNRANFIEGTTQSSFVVFGSSAFPTNPLPAYGRYTLTLPPRQVQLAARISF